MKIRGELGVLLLTDKYDTILVQVHKGKIQEVAEKQDPLMDILDSMQRGQQVELICEQDDSKTGLKDQLQRFVNKVTIVKRKNIEQFF